MKSIVWMKEGHIQLVMMRKSISWNAQCINAKYEEESEDERYTKGHGIAFSNDDDVLLG